MGTVVIGCDGLLSTQEVRLPEFLFRTHDGIERRDLRIELPDQASALREAHQAASDIVQEMLARRVPSAELVVELHHADHAIARIMVVLENTRGRESEPQASTPRPPDWTEPKAQ